MEKSRFGPDSTLASGFRADASLTPPPLGASGHVTKADTLKSVGHSYSLFREKAGVAVKNRLPSEAAEITSCSVKNPDTSRLKSLSAKFARLGATLNGVGDRLKSFFTRKPVPPTCSRPLGTELQHRSALEKQTSPSNFSHSFTLPNVSQDLLNRMNDGYAAPKNRPEHDTQAPSTFSVSLSLPNISQSFQDRMNDGYVATANRSEPNNSPSTRPASSAQTGSSAAGVAHGSSRVNAAAASGSHNEILEAMRDQLDKLPHIASKPLTNQQQAEIKQRIGEYLRHTADFRGETVEKLLASPGLDLPKLMGSMKIYSSLDARSAEKMAFRRQLFNVGMSGTDPKQNEAVLGCQTSYAIGTGKALVTRPGNQLSLAMDTLMMRSDGAIKKVTIMSCSAPALDSEQQPEWSRYMGTDRRLNLKNYAKAIATIENHILQCVRDKQGSAKRMVLAGIGLASFLTGVQDMNDREAARAVVIHALARITTETRKLGMQVGFTDLDNELCNEINQLLPKDQNISVVGTVPGPWIENGDIILNAWDPNSLVGNKMNKDRSLDGFIGRSSLVHVQHAMAGILRKAGVGLNA